MTDWFVWGFGYTRDMGNISTLLHWYLNFTDNTSKDVKGDRELFWSECMSSALEWTTSECNYFTASLKFDNKYKTFEAKIIQES